MSEKEERPTTREDIEILPAERRRFRTRSGRVFDAEGHVDRTATRASDGGAGQVAFSARKGCTFSLTGWLGRLIAVGLLLLLGAMLLELLGRPVAETVQWARDSGLQGRLAIIVGVALITPIFLPAGPVAIIPGYLWGELEGTVLVLCGAALGGLLNMGISRRLLGRRLSKWADRNPIVASLKRTIDRRGMRIAMALRMSPVMPYSLLSYMVGLTSLPWRSWLLASVIGGIPWTLVYATAGALLAASGEAPELEATPAVPGASMLRWVGLAFTLGVALWVGQAARRDLRRMKAEVAAEAGVGPASGLK